MAQSSHFRKTDDDQETDTDLLEDAMDVVLHDTEVVHYPDSVENFELYGDDNEVVPDSDDETMVTNGSKDHSRRGVSFIESLAVELYKVESHLHPSCEKLDQSNKDIDASGGRLTSCQATDLIVCEGEVSPITVHSDSQADDFKHPTDSICCDANSADDFKRKSMESKVGKNANLSQLKKKEIRLVYTRKTKRSCKPKGYESKDVKTSIGECDDIAGLSYVESQEPEDVSTALLFVDQYLSVNTMPMSPSPFTAVKENQTSPPALSVKGAQSLVKLTSVCNSKSKLGIFEWNDSFDGNGECSHSENRVKKYDHTYVRRSPSVKSSVLTEQFYEKEAILTKTEFDVIPEDCEYAFDVGIGTQIAVEAIQALSSVVSADQCPQELPKKSGEDTQNQMQIGVLCFPKKRRSAYRNTLGPNNSKSVYCSNELEDLMDTSKNATRRNNGKLIAPEGLVRKMSKDSDEVQITKKAKACRGKEVYIFKENLKGSLSNEDESLCKLNNRRKVKNIYPEASNLKSSSLFNIHEGLVREPMSKIHAYKKSRRYTKRKDIGVIGVMLDVSSEKGDHSKHFSDTLIIKEMNLNNEDKYLAEDDREVGTIVEKQCDQMENRLHNIVKDGSTKVTSECNIVWSTNWCSRDYPRGKRTRRSMLDYSEAYSDLDNSSTKRSREKQNHYPLRCQLNAKKMTIKRKRRSTIYLSPCLLSSKKSERNLLRHPDSTLKRMKNISSNQLTLDVAVCKAIENMNSNDAAFPSCQASTSEINSINWVNGYHKQHDMRKTPTSALTRELHRLEFGKSMPDFKSKSSRRRKTMADIRVLLSQNLDETTRKHQMKILMRFGVPITSCPSNATHFVTNRFSRTRNMLEFIGQGKPVVTHQWLESCDQAGFYIDDMDYIVRDVKKERELGFKLPVSLDRARHHPLLRSYKVFITPHAKPGKEILASLVKAVHGEVVDVVINSIVDNLLILSCDEDQAYCTPFLERGTEAYSSELLLNGIIIQKLEFARHKLFLS